MNSRLARVALIGLVLVGACSDGGGGGGGGVPNSDATDNTTDASGTGGTDTPEFVAVDVPAGVNWEAATLTPPSATGPAVPSFDQVTATAGVPAAPAGYPFRQSDYISELFVIGDVQLATGTCGCWQGGDSSGVFGGLRTPVYLFRSADAGATWAQVNLAGVLGDVNGRINSIVEHDGAMILTATTSDATGTAPTVIDILRSTDGATWQRLSRVASDAPVAVAVHAFAMYPVGSSLLLYGGDMACSFDGSSAIQNIGPAYQSRFWTSTDGGATWVAQSAEDTGLAAGRPPLPDAAACNGLGIQDVLDAYASNPRLVTFEGDRAMVWSSDGATIVSTTDGTTWSASTLDGALAQPVEGGAEPEMSSQAAAILSVDGGLVALNLENYRNFDDTYTGSSAAYTVIAWASADGGATWQRQPLGRPIETTSYVAAYEFFLTDAGIGLRAFDRADDVEYGMYESVAGSSQDWTTCVAEADANCSFATNVGPFGPGADLSGINLSFASLEGRDLTNVSFAGAMLRYTDLTDSLIGGNNFDAAQLVSVTLTGDLSAATFDGATLTSVTFDDRFFSMEFVGATLSSPRIIISDDGLPDGVVLSGRDLTGYEFTEGSLAGVDFSGANLSRSSFSYTDLTGAVFTGANLEGVFFFEVTCPDGQPAGEEYGPARCRL